MATEKAIEICRNLKQTINKITSRIVIGNGILDGRSIFAGTRASKSMLQRKLDYLIKQHKINKKEL